MGIVEHGGDCASKTNQEKHNTMNINNNIERRGESFWLRKQHGGKRHVINLNTTSRKVALARARSIWRGIVGGATEAAIAGLAGGGTVKVIPTLGRITDTYLEAPIDLPRTTRTNNVARLHRILLEARGITEPELEPVTILSADLIGEFLAVREATPPRLPAWEQAARQPHERSRPGKLTPADLNRARTTARSIVCQARGIFKKELTDPDFGIYSEYELPETLKGFMRRPLPRVHKRVYTPPGRQEMGRILGALPALEETNPAAFVAVLLALALGLRRGEIIKARWSMIHWLEGEGGGEPRPFIKLTDSADWKGTKGRAERMIPIPPAVYAKLISHQDNPTYLVPDNHGREMTEAERAGGRAPGNGFPGAAHYRASTSGMHGLSADVNAWLRGIGWQRRQGLHELRKFYGAMIATASGNLYEAQKLLGHVDVNTTRDTYAALLSAPDYNDAIEERLGLAATA